MPELVLPELDVDAGLSTKLNYTECESGTASSLKRTYLTYSDRDNLTPKMT